ncbi:MAG: ATPase, T2SS/T4P/T4SS family, partial [Proteobacteria bacterium]|nr:ATPase, T2SS/T4P/T4SS family [Pseudomonadota bacterium]
INDAIGLSFAAALRSILRQDPDVIMVGEIRDLETAEIAARSALTGHLVLSTIHTNDTISTISRLTGIGLPPYIVSSAVSGIFAQRLVRRICTHCKTETAPPLELMGDKFPPLKVYYKGTGCNNCQHTGYRGQVGIYEFLPVDANLKKLIAMDATEHELWSAARESGLVTLFEDAWGKVKEGLTTVEEVIAKIPYKAIHTGIRGLEEEHKTRVLLYNVPDTEQSIISTTLDPDSYEVIQVTGEEFMEATRRTNPDIILIVSSQDLFTSLKELRSDIRYAYTPVFVLASPDETTYKDKGFELGIKDLIYRPIDPRNLFTMIDHCLKVN